MVSMDLHFEEGVMDVAVRSQTGGLLTHPSCFGFWRLSASEERGR